MRLPFFHSRRTGRSGDRGVTPVISLFSKFRRIQELNTRALELMAEMEEALGGEYIFDRAFLESAVHELGTLTYQVAYSLNAMSENRYIALYDRYQSIKGILDDILRGGLGPFAASLVLPYPDLDWEMEPLVGTLNVCLARARTALALPAPDGFAVTVTGCRLLEKSRVNPVREGVSGYDEFPAALGASLSEETDRLFSRRGGPVPLTVRACTAGGNGQEIPDLKGVSGVLPADLTAACQEALNEYAQWQDSAESAVSPALAVHEAVSPDLAGSVTTVHSSALSAELYRITAAPAENAGETESYLLRKIYPFELLQSRILAKDFNTSFPSGDTPLSMGTAGLRRGSAFLKPPFLRRLAEYAAAFERMLGGVIDLDWVRPGVGEAPVVMNIRPVTGEFSDAAPAREFGDVLRDAQILLQGGETVQTGIAAGRAVHVKEDDLPESFPHGAVAIARTASPSLSPILKKAAALVTEIGTSIGHLATIARELRVPSIFGLPGALEGIPADVEVTVDAGERTIYKGVIEPLLALRACTSDLYPNDPEYIALRRLLRWIMPLWLIDPESNAFSTENCRTYHDIIHFSHERSVEELLQLQDRGRGLADLNARKMDLNIPVELHVIDIGGGLSNTKTGGRVSPGEVISEPFAAFLNGFASKEMWDRESSSIRIKDIFWGMDRTFSAMTNLPEYSGSNHAIIADSYMNLGLRLGYHFSVIDSFIGKSINQNYIYFRFVGGFADEKRRRRRAELIRTILEGLRFRVMVKGDLIVGKLKMVPKAELATALTRIGALTGFTRQLDISMIADENIAQFVSLFNEKTAADGEDGENG